MPTVRIRVTNRQPSSSSTKFPVSYFRFRKKRKEKKKKEEKRRNGGTRARSHGYAPYVEFQSRVIDTVGHVVFRHSTPRCRSIDRCVTFRITNFPATWTRRENTVRGDGEAGSTLVFRRPVRLDRNRVERWEKGGRDAWSRLKPRETAIALATSVVPSSELAQ